MQDDDVFVPGTEEQPALDNELIEPDWKTEWRGMPSYEHQDLMPEASLLVHFKSLQDRAAFAKLVGQTLHSNTKFIWYPKAEIRKAADKVFTVVGKEKVTPRYPVYIISKGRWESRLTSRSLEWLKVPYHIVVEPQEAEQYAKVIDPAKILTLPFSNLGLGGIPARNWVWEHAVATGAERHWILDDNIGGFCRFQDNLKVEVDNGATFCAAEDFVDRYENVVMAAFNYDYFAPRTQGGKIKPITLNTRCYSGILLSNKIPYRWRGRYNEDTDLSLRILKDGLCTVLFNALLMYKKPTLTMKGGNTDELYKGVEAAALEWQTHAAECSACRQCLDGYDGSKQPCPVGREILSKDGRWLMAESLREQHPDQVSVERKWGRWQHQVDYRRFVPRLGFNVPRLRPGIEIKDGADEYGMELDAMPQDEVPGTRPTVVSPGASSAPSTAAPRPSVLDFVRKAAEAPKPEAAQPVPVQPVPAVPAAVGPVRAEAMACPQTEPEQAAGRPEAASEGYSAVEFRAALEARGHRPFVHDGRLFVTGASALSDVDRELMNEHRAALIALLEPPVADSDTHALIDQEPRPGQSIAQFLGTEAPRIDPDWRPDEIPSHIDDKEIVLNFATSGLEWAKGDRPVGVTVGTLDGKFRRFLPFAFEGGGNLDEGAVKRFVKEVIRGKRITNANTRFDVHMARAWDVDLEEQGCTFSDVQHAAALLDDHRKQFRLDVLARDYLPDLPMVERVDESRHADYHASEVAKRELFTAELVARLHAVIDPQIDEQELREVQRLEDAVIPCVVEMERNGAPLNLELLDEYGAECTRRYERLLSEVAAEAGFAFDHTSKSWQRLFETLGLPATDSVKESVIGIIDHPLVKKAHLAAQYASLNSKTFKAYKENVGSDGILRFDINQLRGDDGGTVSGRFSIGYVQQVPNADNHGAVFGNDLFPRRLFVPGEGLYLESDARQIEYRLGAHHANNAKILAAYKENPLISYHEITWEMMKRYKPNMLYAHQKSFNFAKQYGARSVKLAIMMGFITEDEGAEIRATKSWNDPRLDVIHEIEAAYKQMMPEGDYLLDYAAHLAKPKCDESCKLNDDLHRNYQHRGYVKTLLGRRSRFPTGWKTYIGWNRVIQGTAADVMKQKLVELHRERKTTGFVMRLTIHDQVAGDATMPETAERVGEILNHQSFPQLRVPILWTVKTGKNWADCK